jgi:hypothetical protein
MSTERGTAAEQARDLDADEAMVAKLKGFEVCPMCGESKDAHTWFGRVLNNPAAWHAFSAYDRPSDVD